MEETGLSAGQFHESDIMHRSCRASSRSLRLLLVSFLDRRQSRAMSDVRMHILRTKNA